MIDLLVLAGEAMRTRLQCLQMAAYCERLARESITFSNRHLLIEAANQWRSSAAVSRSEVLPWAASEPIDDSMLVQMLSDVGCLFR
jgi:hypothetical protein